MYDSLDTMLLMGLHEEFSDALPIIREGNFRKVCIQSLNLQSSPDTSAATAVACWAVIHERAPLYELERSRSQAPYPAAEVIRVKLGVSDCLCDRCTSWVGRKSPRLWR